MEWDPQRVSAPSTPSSLSSHSAGNGNSLSSTTRSEKIPTLKQLSPSPSVTALSKLDDDDLRKKGLEDLLRILRRVEIDYKALLGEHGNIVKDVNRRFQIFVLETRSLKDANQKFQDDNQELRDLCCFLDDDRQRGRKLAREWQRFGRYTASVMRSEVAVYQEKLSELEERQSELATENMELKELCLFLDQERSRMPGDRDEGDGSSNGTVTAHEDGMVAMDTTGSITPTPAAPAPTSFAMTPSSAVSYIKALELKVNKLEEEKKSLVNRFNVSVDGIADGSSDPSLDQSVHANGSSNPDKRASISGKPEAVVHAMKVLQVHEELERGAVEEEVEVWDDSEKAIVREMCNVVWRKLGDVGDVGEFNESSDSLLDPPPFVPDSPIKVNTSLISAEDGAPDTRGLHILAQPGPQMASTPLAALTRHTRLGAPHPGQDGPHQFHNHQARSQDRPVTASNPNPNIHRQLPALPQTQGQPSQPFPVGPLVPPYTNNSQPSTHHRQEPHQRPDMYSQQPGPPPYTQPPKQLGPDQYSRGQPDFVPGRDRFQDRGDRHFDPPTHHPPPYGGGREEERKNPDLRVPPSYKGDNSGHPYHPDSAGYPNRPAGTPRRQERQLPPPPNTLPRQEQRQPPPQSYPNPGAHNLRPEEVPPAHYPSGQYGQPNVGRPTSRPDTKAGSNYAIIHSNQARNPASNPHSQPQVRLLDAPGVPRYNPADGGQQRQIHQADSVASAQPRPRSRGAVENRFEGREPDDRARSRGAGDNRFEDRGADDRARSRGAGDNCFEDRGPDDRARSRGAGDNRFEDRGADDRARSRGAGDNRFEDRGADDRVQKSSQPSSRSASSTSAASSYPSHSGLPNGPPSLPQSGPPSSLHSSGRPTPSQSNATVLSQQSVAQSIPGFRAYPPPSAASQGPPAPRRSGGLEEPRRESGGGYRGGQPSGQPPPPTPRSNLNPIYNNPSALRGVGNKRFQEQEWRQTYLDDSDTL